MGTWLMKFEVEADLGVDLKLGELVFRQPDGRFTVHLKNHQMEPGCDSPSLHAYFSFQADDIDRAEAAGEEHCARFLDFLVFATGARFHMSRRVCVFDWAADVDWRHGYIYKQFPNPDLPQLVLDQSTSSTLTLLLSADANADLMQAVHWFSAAASATSAEEQFELFWFSIETIARCSEDKTRVPDKCAVCQEPLYCPKCKEVSTHRPYPSQKIQRLFARHVSKDADEMYRMTSRMRNALLHGDRVISVEAAFGFSLSQLVDLLARVAWAALLENILPTLGKEGTGRLGFILPNTFLRHRVEFKGHIAFQSPPGRPPVFTDLPTSGIDVNLIVTDPSADHTPTER